MSILPVNLPDRVSPGQPVSAAWANSIREAIARLANRKQTCPKGGQLIDIDQGAFWTRYRDSESDTYLQAGTVTGGNGGSATVADYKVLDADTGVGSLADQILYLQVACEATIEDGIMMPGCTITTATLETGATVPDNHTFTVAAASGNIYMEVGRWTATDFLPSGPPGNFLASGCIGNFSLSKVT